MSVNTGLIAKELIKQVSLIKQIDSLPKDRQTILKRGRAILKLYLMVDNLHKEGFFFTIKTNKSSKMIIDFRTNKETYLSWIRDCYPSSIFIVRRNK